MTCREAERLVMPYINGSITDDELEEFLKHIDQCEECREELEIYFTVDVGIRQLDVPHRFLPTIVFLRFLQILPSFCLLSFCHEILCLYKF